MILSCVHPSLLPHGVALTDDEAETISAAVGRVRVILVAYGKEANIEVRSEVLDQHLVCDRHLGCPDVLNGVQDVGRELPRIVKP